MTELTNNSDNKLENWCSECESGFPDHCPAHGVFNVIRDNKPPNKAYYTLPDELTIKPADKTSIGKCINGVFSKMAIKPRTQFGPVEAPRYPESKRKDKADKFQLKVVDKNKVFNLRLKDERVCNWMMFIRPACSLEQQNMVAILHNNNIYYITIKPITSNSELRVWYSRSYSEKISKNLLVEANSSTGSVCDNLPIFFTEIDKKMLLDDQGNDADHLGDIAVEVNNDGDDGNDEDYSVEDVPKSRSRETRHRKEVLFEDPGEKTREFGKRKSKRRIRPKIVASMEEEEDTKIKTKISKPKIKSPRKVRYVCQICEQGFRREDAFRVHVASHSGTMPFLCDFEGCNKGFKNKFLYIRHQVVHQDILKVRCPYCDKTFRRKDHLKNHLLIHDLNRTTWDCEICDKSYIREESFKFHQAMHQATDTDSLNCFICDECFKTKTDLISHLKDVHNRYQSITGKARTLKCPECDKMFLCNKDVKRHMVVHTKRKDYLCEFCSQVFGRKDHLSRHYKCAHPNGAASKVKTPKQVKNSVKSALKNRQTNSEKADDKVDHDFVFNISARDGPDQSDNSILQIPHQETHHGRFIPPSYEDVTSRPQNPPTRAQILQQTDSLSNSLANIADYSSQGVAGLLTGRLYTQPSPAILSSNNQAYNNSQFSIPDGRNFDTDHSYMLNSGRSFMGQTVSNVVPSIKTPELVWNSEEMKKREYETASYLQSFASGSALNNAMPLTSSGQTGHLSWDPINNMNYVPVLQQLSVSSTNQPTHNMTNIT
ncbi:PR domain zinc finger protein 10 isoform X1 [Patella vulgata]|uniref:PR domain zinc finger protein 10 isoform X1 n=2 Tax=Patella vulgata TaxID=6465 RepID=UPI00217F5A47|nr:PR domain zinc finger protein 10 isoform X1 [Patella vulgata]XP_050403540.1 PR domain zinc finger protein 10 isoform X1 [Patella vulgata]XP_050403541.1 PR domain zinc finger protein 10 isoform X1 [Patella vulgata]